MALPPLASVADLAAWVGQDIPDADPRAAAVLSAASAVVRGYTRPWVVGADIDPAMPEIVRVVTVQVAGRVWVNPDGVTSVTLDDGTRRWEGGTASGLRLTLEERDLLADFASGTRGVGVLSTTRGEGLSGTVYVPTGPPPSGPPFPWYRAEDL